MAVRLSRKHGVNPSMMVCFYCNEPYGVALLGRLRGDAEAPRQAVYNMQPCPQCEGWMSQGVILISVRDGESGENPYRTGGWVVATDEAISRMLDTKTAEHILKCRWAFVPDAGWDILGLPREEE